MTVIVAVTGICSSLGRALAPVLQDDPSIEKIIGIDIVPCAIAPEKSDFFKVDVRDKEGLAGALANVDVAQLAGLYFPRAEKDT